MQLKKDDVEFCLEIAIDVSDHYGAYSLVPDHPKRSVDALRYVISLYLGKSFQVRKLKQLKGSIHALCLVKVDGSYEVYVLEGLDEAQTRFAVVKELFHVAIDKVECRSMNIWDHLEEVTSTFPVHDSEPNCPAAWEVLAEAAAMEFLVPLKDREALVAQKNPDYSVAAARYGVPQKLLESYCTEGNMEFFREYHRSRIGG